jgi:hypothetical protein
VFVDAKISEQLETDIETSHESAKSARAGEEKIRRELAKLSKEVEVMEVIID